MLYTPLQPLLRLLKKHAFLNSAMLAIMTVVNDVLLSLAYLLLASYTFVHLVMPIEDLSHPNNTLGKRQDDGWAPLPRPGGELRPTIEVGGEWMEEKGAGEMKIHTQGLGLGRATVGVAVAVGVWFVVSAGLGAMGVITKRQEERRRREVEEEEVRRVEEKNAVVDDARSVAESV